MNGMVGFWIDARIGLANWLWRRGDDALARGSPVAARWFFVAALRTFRRLGNSVAAPDRTISSVLLAVGDALSQQAKVMSAMAAFDEAVSLRRKLLLVAPNAADAKEDLAIALEREGALAFHRLSDLGRAYLIYDEALQLRTQVAQARSTETAKLDLALTQGQLGSVHRALEQFDTARPLLEGSLDSIAELGVENPSSQIIEKAIALGLVRLGLLHLDIGDLPAARELLENANYIRHRLMTENPTSRDHEIDYGIGLVWLGAVLAMERNSFGAQSRLQEAVELFGRVDRRGETALVAQHLWISMWNMALHVPDGPITWMDVVAQMERLRRRGMLWTADEVYLSEAQAYANGGVPGRVDGGLLNLIERSSDAGVDVRFGAQRS